MKNTTNFLAMLGVTMQQANTFVVSNLNHPDVILNTCKEYGITSSMLADIANVSIPGVTVTDVKDFFQTQGVDASALDHVVLDVRSLTKPTTYDTLTLDAGNGSYQFLIDMNKQHPLSNGGSDSTGTTLINNFGADDSIQIFGHYTGVTSFSQPSVFIKTFGAYSGTYEYITLMGVNTESHFIAGIDAFNALPVGDIV